LEGLFAVKIKLDENIPIGIAADLSALGHDVQTVYDEKLVGKPDRVVWDAVCFEQRFFITQDMDFSDIRLYAPGTHPGILLVRLQKPGKNLIRSEIVRIFKNEAISSWQRAFVILSDAKIRVIKHFREIQPS
jgi:predicted nuclease of predicted toxin-antitoxin system